MASRASIEFDFQKATAQADRLDTVADQLNMLSDRSEERRVGKECG